MLPSGQVTVSTVKRDKSGCKMAILSNLSTYFGAFVYRLVTEITIATYIHISLIQLLTPGESRCTPGHGGNRAVLR